MEDGLEATKAAAEVCILGQKPESVESDECQVHSLLSLSPPPLEMQTHKTTNWAKTKAGSAVMSFHRQCHVAWVVYP